MPPTPPGADVLVVGAGLAGLTAALAMHEHGVNIMLLEAEDRVGGRLATQSLGPGLADTGAQFFTARSPELQARVEDWLADGLIYVWAHGWSRDPAMPPQSDGFPRYAVRGGMQALAGQLARDLDVRLGVRLKSVSHSDTGWRASDTQRTLYTGRALLLTPPGPQSLDLLGKGDEVLTPGERAALERISYAPGITGLFLVEGPVNLPEPGALQRPDAAISWIADNQRKGISPDARLITVHASPKVSRHLWDAPDDEVLVALRSGLDPFLDPAATIFDVRVKRWPYALPTVLHPDRYLLALTQPPLAFAGDAFDGPRVEGAFLSGLAAGRALVKAIS